MQYAHSVYSDMKPNEHGGTEGDHIKALQAMGADVGKKEIEKPKLLWYLWELHREMRLIPTLDDKGEPVMTMGEPLNRASICEYCDSLGVELDRFELNAIMGIDSIMNRFLDAAS